MQPNIFRNTTKGFVGQIKNTTIDFVDPSA